MRKEGGDNLYIVTSFDHKTNMVSPCKLVFDIKLYERARTYKKVIRPRLVVQRGDIAEFFVLPGSKPIQKMSNMTRIVQKNLGLDDMPTATEVRKMGSRAAQQ